MRVIRINIQTLDITAKSLVDAKNRWRNIVVVSYI